MFITESMRMLAASPAFLISSALCSSGSVGAWTTSKPASLAILKRSAMLSFAGNIPNQTPFLMESVGGNNGVSEGTLTASESARARPLRPAVQATRTEDFRNSRRDGRRIVTPQRSLFKSIFESHTSLDFIVSSQLTSCPVYAAVRAMMQDSADSEPFAAWLWKFPLVMLSTKAFFFSRSANSKLDVKLPVTENACDSVPGLGV